MGFGITYKVSDVADIVKRTFGDESGVQVTDADILRWVNAGQIEIVSNNQVLKAVGTKLSVKDQYAYSLSADMDIQYINSIHYDGVKLAFKSFHDAELYLESEDPQRTVTGTPIFWYEWAGEISLYPTPSESDKEIKVYFNPLPAKKTSLTDDLSLPDNYYNRLVEYVLAQAYEMDENFSAYQMKREQFQNSLMGMSNDENQAQVDTYPTITVRPEDM
jgi:hypothetical protein